jgi:hypothetical protein
LLVGEQEMNRDAEKGRLTVCSSWFVFRRRRRRRRRSECDVILVRKKSDEEAKKKQKNRIDGKVILVAMAGFEKC